MSERRYRTAYGIAKFSEVFGWIVMCVGIIAGIAVGSGEEIKELFRVVIALSGVFAGLAIVFYSQLLLVAIDTENNTHQVATEIMKTNAMLAETLGSINVNVNRIACEKD